MKFPSVTQVLSPWGAYNTIPTEVLRQAQERGKVVHAACFAVASGLWHPKLSEEHQGYLDSFVNWLDSYVQEVVLVEPEFVCEKKGFVGHPDFVLVMKGDGGLYSIPDLKTPLTHSRAWGPQCAAYQYLAAINKYPVGRIFSIRLRPDGSPALLNEYTGTFPYELTIFFNALACWKYFKGG